MKINPTGIPAYVEGKRRTNNSYESHNNVCALSTGDELTVSADMISFSKLYAAAREAYSFLSSESSRVSDITARISDGSYYIDSETLASRILGE